MSDFRVRVQCKCGSFQCEKVRTVGITTHKHFTDHEVTYCCKDCGLIFVVGAVVHPSNPDLETIKDD